MIITCLFYTAFVESLLQYHIVYNSGHAILNAEILTKASSMRISRHICDNKSIDDEKTHVLWCISVFPWTVHIKYLLC